MSKTSKLVRPQTKAQSLASHENFALFQLKGMISNLAHLKKVIPISLYDMLEINLQANIRYIKRIQTNRNPKLLKKGRNLDETKQS